MKEVIKSLKNQEKKVGNEIDNFKNMEIDGLEKTLDANKHILGHKISRESPHTMMGKKLIKQ